MNWEHYRVRMGNILASIQTLLQWALVSVLIGICCGLLGALFYTAVHAADQLFAFHAEVLFLLPFAGLLIEWLYNILHCKGNNTDTVIEAAQSGKEIPLQLLPGIFIGTALSHLFGASCGREGAALQMGGDIGWQLAKLFHLREENIKIAVMTGMAAFFSAIFGLPVTAVMFVTLVIQVGAFIHIAVFPELIASLTAYAIASHFGVTPMRYEIVFPEETLQVWIGIAVLALLSGILSTLFCDTMHFTAKLMAKYLKNSYVRIFVGGCLTALLLYLMGSTRYSGSGSQIIAGIMDEGDLLPWDFAVKMIISAIALGCGFRGGEVLPAFTVGAAFGGFLAPFFGLPVSFGAGIGMIAIFGGCSNGLIAPVFLGLEVFGTQGINYFVFAGIIAFVVSGYAGFYDSQEIMYSKMHPRMIHIHTNEYHAEKEQKEKTKEGQ